MGLTKIEMWFGIIIVVLIFAFSIVAVGSDLMASDITLDARSQNYVTEFNTNIDENNLDDYADNESLADKEKNPLVELVTNLPIIQDILGGINFFIDKTKQVMAGISLIYNLPSFFISGFGLPVGAFSHVINILGAILYLAFTVMMVRLVK